MRGASGLTKLFLDEVDTDMDESYFTISTIEGGKIDEVCKDHEKRIAEVIEGKRVPKECDQVAMVLGEISSVLDALTLDGLLRRRADLARDEGTIGATTAIEQQFLLDDENNDDFDDGSEERSEGDEGEAIGDVYETTTPGAGTEELDLDQVFAAGVGAIHQGKANAKHLAIIWRISYDDTTRTIDAMSQHSERSEDPTLSQNYVTNNHMLQYRRIKDYFFMDTFFATRRWQVLTHEHMLSTLCHGQRVSLRGSNEAEIGADASSQPIRKGSWSPRCHRVQHGQRTNVGRG